MNECKDSSKYEGATLVDYRNHIWDYFLLHSEQRLKTFHFYLILETALIGGALISLGHSVVREELEFFLGLLMIVFSFVFWKLDQRTRCLINVAEPGLRAFEHHLARELGNEFADGPFISDPQYKNGLNAFPLFGGALSYSKCFCVVFLTFCVIGGLLIAFALFGRTAFFVS